MLAMKGKTFMNFKLKNRFYIFKILRNFEAYKNNSAVSIFELISMKLIRNIALHFQSFLRSETVFIENNIKKFTKFEKMFNVILKELKNSKTFPFMENVDISIW